MEHADLSKKKFSSPTFIAGLALFSMLFGAGNLILPIRSGIIAGDNQLMGFLGFLLSGIGFPLLGLWGIVLLMVTINVFFIALENLSALWLLVCAFLFLAQLSVFHV